MADPYTWRRVAHIPLIIVLQVVFIILFAQFVVYDEHSAVKNVHFDVGYEDDATANPQAEPHDDHDHDHGHVTAEKLVEGVNGTLHETTRDAKEILTDYPSAYIINSILKNLYTLIMNSLIYALKS